MSAYGPHLALAAGDTLLTKTRGPFLVELPVYSGGQSSQQTSNSIRGAVLKWINHVNETENTGVGEGFSFHPLQTRPLLKKGNIKDKTKVTLRSPAGIKGDAEAWGQEHSHVLV